MNNRQKQKLFDKDLSKVTSTATSGKTIALWGLSFKPNTDDMREASEPRSDGVAVGGGARVQAYDPEAMDETRRIYGERDDLTLCSSSDEALDGADALVIVTEWQEFRSPDFEPDSRSADRCGHFRRSQPV